MSYTHNYQMSYIGNATVTTLRDQLFASIQRQPLTFFDGEATGTLMSRLTYDVNLLQDAVTRVVTSFFKDSFTVLGLSAVIFYREWRLALLAMAVFPLAVFLILWLGKRTRRVSHQTQVSNAHLYTVLQESLIGQRIVKAFAREDYEEAALLSRPTGATSAPACSSTPPGSSRPPPWSFWGPSAWRASSSTAATRSSRAPPPRAPSSPSWRPCSCSISPSRASPRVQNIVQEGLAAATRVFGLMDRDPEIKDRLGAVPLPPLQKDIVYQKVAFAYDDDRPVLQDIDLTVGRGEIVALVGPSGAGKSTLLNLLPRFYEVTEGAITIDGVDIRDVTLNSLRAQIGVVTQQTILFNDTVRHNVALWPPGGLRSRHHRGAARPPTPMTSSPPCPRAWTPSSASRGCASPAANASAWPSPGPCSKTRPSSSSTKPPPRSTPNPSGRCSRPWTPSSSAAPPWSSPTASPRCSNAHRIIVLEDGRIVETGSHSDLLAAGGLYRRLYEMQFAQEEEKEQPAAEP